MLLLQFIIRLLFSIKKCENFTLEFEADDYKLAEILNLALRKTDELFKIAKIGKNWVKNNCSLDNYGLLI